jgi:hypothetical protein
MATNTTTVTVIENGVINAFRVVPLTSISEFIENAAMLVKCTDVALGAEMGWWEVVA